MLPSLCNTNDKQYVKEAKWERINGIFYDNFYITNKTGSGLSFCHFYNLKIKLVVDVRSIFNRNL